MNKTVIDQAEKQAALCRVIGHSRRLLILWQLSDGELSVNEIAAQVGSTLQNISQHLTLLKKYGFVTARREGQTIYYRIAEHECVRGCPALLRPPETLTLYST
jgi:DNA-binding transcriptional ArsR family regulator